MGIRKMEVRLEDLTPELARSFAGMTTFEGERTLKPMRLAFLRRHVKQGTFASPTWADAVLRGTDKRYRLNGQHSSTMLSALAPEEFPKGLKVTIETYEFDSIADDAFSLFDLFDNPKSARDNTDALGIDIAPFEDLRGIDLKFAGKVAAGIACFEAQKKEGGIFHDARRRGVYFYDADNRTFLLWMWPFRDALHIGLLNPPVMSEVYSDWTYNAAMAQEFWSLVLYESHSDPDHETRELSRVLKEMKQAEKGPEYFHSRVRKAWNRYRRVRELEAKTTEPRPTKNVSEVSPQSRTSVSAESREEMAPATA